MKYSYSLIICCYNSERVIVPTIKAINNLELSRDSNVELIIVDNNCADNTVALIQDNWAQPNVELLIVNETMPGLMYARRKGVESAKKEVVVFIDDDNILSSDWLMTLDSAYQEYDSAGCIGGYNQDAIDGDVPSWFEQYKAVYACGHQAKESTVVTKSRMTLFGAGLSFKADVLKNIFNESVELFLTGRTKNILLRGDDSELCMRCIMLGYDVVYVDSLKLLHNILPERISWTYVQQARFGGGIAELVLSMYRQANLGKSVSSYFGQFSRVVFRWLKFIKRFDNVKKRNSEGSVASFEFSYLKGMTYGLYYFNPVKYSYIRNHILSLTQNM